MRHKWLPVSAGYAIVCTHSPVGGEELVHHYDSGVLEVSMPVRSVELHPIWSDGTRVVDAVSMLSKTATGAMA